MTKIKMPNPEVFRRAHEELDAAAKVRGGPRRAIQTAQQILKEIAGGTLDDFSKMDAGIQRALMNAFTAAGIQTDGPRTLRQAILDLGKSLGRSHWGEIEKTFAGPQCKALAEHLREVAD